MKRFSIAMVSAFLALSLIGFVSCSSDSDDDDDTSTTTSSSSSTITLPESVGTDELSGTSWSYDNSSGEGEVTTWTFKDGTATEKVVRQSKNMTEINEYTYSYDSTKKLVYLALTKYTNTDDEGTVSFSSAAAAKAEAAKDGATGTELDHIYEQYNAAFSTKTVYKYTIEDTSLTLDSYFDGTLPTMAELDNEIDEVFIDFGCIVLGKDTPFYATVSGNTLTGTVYAESGDEIVKLGTATGTYTASGAGTSDCTVTITFSALPSGVTAVTTNTAYTFTQFASSKTFTK